MGQYFEWVNFDKGEIIATWPWPNGQKLHECAYVGCEETDAALTMLAGEWAGDFVVFLGDCATFENETYSNHKELQRRLKGMNLEDYVFDCKDICGRFDYVRRHPEATYPVYGAEPGEEVERHYEGPYDIAIRHFRYVVNESKREYVDRVRTAVRSIDSKSGRIVRYDPFPQLMCSETLGIEHPEREIDGLWFGDLIRPTDEHPGDDYAAVAQRYSHFGPPLTCSDDEIRRIISEHRLNIADKNILEQIYACALKLAEHD